jgi:hypothetical protein
LRLTQPSHHGRQLVLVDLRGPDAELLGESRADVCFI